MKITNLVLCFILVVISLHIYYVKRAYSLSNITNQSFENGKTSWTTNNSGVIFSISNEGSKDASSSATISNQSTTSYGVEQIVTEIISNESYILSGWLKSSTIPQKAYLRIAWYQSVDGSGSQLKTDDSPIFTGPVNSWTKIEAVAQAPNTAQSAKIRILVAGGQINVDDINFSKYISPVTPTPTLINTPEILPNLISDSSPTTAPTRSQEYYQNIYLSEAMVAPDTGQPEWIEIYNNNDRLVDLGGSYIDDVDGGGGSPRLISALNMNPKSYSIFELSSSLFNNDGDEVRLLSPEKKVIDSFTYDGTEKGYSWGRVSFTTHEFCQQLPSKLFLNTGCYNKIETVDTSDNSKSKIAENPLNIKKQGFTLGQSVKGSSNKSFKRYAIPPTIVQLDFQEAITQNHVLEEVIPEKSETTPLGLPALAFSYSLLSTGSIVVKILLT